MLRGIARDNIEYDILSYLSIWDLYNIRYLYPEIYKRELDLLSSTLKGQLEMFKLALVKDDLDLMSLLDKIMITHLYVQDRHNPYNEHYKLIEQLYDMLIEESTSEGRSLEALVQLLSYSGRIFKISPSLKEWRSNEYDIIAPMYNEDNLDIARVLTSDVVVDNISPRLYFIYSLVDDDEDTGGLVELKMRATIRIYENVGYIPEVLREGLDVYLDGSEGIDDQGYIELLKDILEKL